MNEICDWIEAQLPAMTETLLAWSNINSYSRNVAGLATMLGVIEKEFATLGGESRRVALPQLEEIDDRGNVARSPLGEALQVTKRPDAKLKVLLNIHYDTVF